VIIYVYGMMIVRDVWKTENRFGFSFKKSKPSKNLTSIWTVFE